MPQNLHVLAQVALYGRAVYLSGQGGRCSTPAFHTYQSACRDLELAGPPSEAGAQFFRTVMILDALRLAAGGLTRGLHR